MREETVEMVQRFGRSLSILGVLFGLVFFCASLTPSLLPRVPVVQGALAGVAFVAGYALANTLLILWNFLELKQLAGPWKYRLSIGALIVAIGLALLTLNRMLVWQNAIRGLMEMEPVDSAYPVSIATTAFVTIVLLLLFWRGLVWSGKRVVAWINRILPRRISIGMGTVVVALAFGAAVDSLVVRNALSFMDRTFAEVDRIIDDGVRPPADFDVQNSLIRWEDIGRNGKRFLTDGPDQEEIAAFTGRPARQPIRVIAGVNSEEDVDRRAALAVAELKRQGGFDREVLVVATPTGTGWLDPAAIQPVPYLHGGDLAIVSMQYSYLPSWLTLMVDPARSSQAARALFQQVFAHWKTLPPESRPRLYLFGLSLGALGSEASTDLVELLADPIQGAVWAGPPFASRAWTSLTRGREVGSPEWRPRFRDGAMVRFMTQDGFDPGGYAPWGPLRIVYLQHASDPMSFFSPNLAWTRPAWLGEDRGRDVSPFFRWFPVVTFLQVGFDIPMATSVSPGFGHNFVAAEYIDAWIEVTQPSNWSAEDTRRLKQKYEDFDASPI